jgi:hypothetical protein
LLLQQQRLLLEQHRFGLDCGPRSNFAARLAISHKGRDRESRVTPMHGSLEIRHVRMHCAIEGKVREMLDAVDLAVRFEQRVRSVGRRSSR